MDKKINGYFLKENLRALKFLVFSFLILLFFGLVSAFFYYSYGASLEITMIDNQVMSFNTGRFLKADLKLDNKDNVEILNGDKAIEIRPLNTGATSGKLMLFNRIRLKNLTVNVVEEKKVYVMGNAVGIRLDVDGVLVESVSSVEDAQGKLHYPAKDAGLEKGDFLVSANGVHIDGVEPFLDIVKNSNEVFIDFKRDSKLYSTKITPIVSKNDEKKIGLWVKDVVNGIGTITYCTIEDDARFGSLGHGIQNNQEQEFLPILGGEIFYTQIASVKRGISGEPGELQGDLLVEYKELGRIDRNCEVGIFGSIENLFIEKKKPEKYQIGYEQHINEGSAYILSNIEADGVNKYDVKIKKITNRPFVSPKGIIIRITDEELLEKTGGIVQGMSGSPIIQDGRIVGAVTHVLVNQPDMGYGVLIEEMLRAGS